MNRFISIRRQLDSVLGSRAKVSSLRVLHDGRPELNGREVARRAGLAPRAAQLALAELARIGAVRMKAVGNNHVFSLNPAFHLYAPALAAAFEAERNAPRDLARELLRRLRGEAVLSVAWFGSAARGERRPDSDMDVVVVLKESRAAGEVRRRLDELVPGLRDRFGFHVAAYVIGARELARKFDAKDPLALNMVKDAVLLHGKPLPEVISGAP